MGEADGASDRLENRSAALPEQILYDLYTGRHLRCPYCHTGLKDLSKDDPQCGKAERILTFSP